MGASYELGPQRGQRRYVALDAFRGLAAFGVALFHFRWIDPALQQSTIVGGLDMLVDFFFVLSGFVLTHAYFGRDDSMAQFVGRRLARLYPMHLFALLMFLVLQGLKMVVETWGGDTRHHAFDGLNVANFADTLLLLQSTGLLWHEISWNAPSWSISTELFANLLVFALLVLLGRRQLNLICGVLLVCIIGFFMAANIGPHDYGPLALLRCIAGFCLGCLVHELFVSTRHNKLVGAGAPSLAATGAEALALVAMLSGILAKPLTGIWFSSSFSFAIVIYVFAFEAGLISRAIERTGLAWFGTISYSVYLNHIFVGSLLSGAFLAVAGRIGLTGPLKIMVYVALFFTVLSVYSWLTYRCIELPAQRYFSPRRKTVAALA